MNNEERIVNIVKNRWINHSKANDILKVLNQLLLFPKSRRMQNILIIGESNSGKTTIAKRFLNQHPSFISEEIEEGTSRKFHRLTKPVIMIQCPYTPSPKMLFFNILNKINIPYKKTIRIEELQDLVIHALQDLKTKVLVLDEIHHILTGNPSQQRVFLALIKYISNEVKISIVGLGTDEAFYAINSDRQLASRFSKLIITRWKYDIEYGRLLKTLEKNLELKNPSNIESKEIAKEIFSKSEGILGEIIKIITLAGIDAIETNEEKITLDTLSRINYVSPSEERSSELLKR